ncbi:MAG: hypothetical protein IJX47_02500, partial [Clostridia bacterium]|nr:hypothetical protein [Clostridia bacterium]
VSESYELALRLLNENIDKLHFIADFLVRYETMDEGQFDVAMNGNPTMEELAEMVDARRRKSQAENEEKARLDQIEAQRKTEEEAKRAEQERQQAEAEDKKKDDEQKPPRDGMFPGFDD